MIDAHPDLTDLDVVCAIDGADVVLSLALSTPDGNVAAARIPLVAVVDAETAERCAENWE